LSVDLLEAVKFRERPSAHINRRLLAGFFPGAGGIALWLEKAVVGRQGDTVGFRPQSSGAARNKTSGVAVCVGTAAANLPIELERPSLIVAG
jgi:hypothetical protein